MKELVQLFIDVYSFTKQEAIELASLNDRLRRHLEVSEVEFTFKKSDGTLRIARGTLRRDRLPETKGTGRPTRFDNQVYYDLDKESFRSFRKANLVSMK